MKFGASARSNSLRNFETCLVDPRLPPNLCFAILLQFFDSKAELQATKRERIQKSTFRAAGRVKGTYMAPSVIVREEGGGGGGRGGGGRNMQLHQVRNR